MEPDNAASHTARMHLFRVHVNGVHAAGLRRQHIEMAEGLQTPRCWTARGQGAQAAARAGSRHACRWQRWSIVEAGMRGKREMTSAATASGLVPKVSVPEPKKRKPRAMLRVGMTETACQRMQQRHHDVQTDQMTATPLT